MRLLDFSITPVVERTVERVWVTYKMGRGFTRSFSQPFTYMTMRGEFDNLLAERAVSAGATLMDGFKIGRIELEDRAARVTGDNGTLRGTVLVGADGANSIVAHQMGLLRDAEIGVGLESEVYIDSQTLDPWAHTASIDLGALRGGYMWVFPKADHLSIGSIGVVGFRRGGPRLRTLLDTYLDHLRLGAYEERITRGHRLPRRRRGMPIQRGNALLVGDAAGLVEFWSGEGIYPSRAPRPPHPSSRATWRGSPRTSWHTRLR